MRVSIIDRRHDDFTEVVADWELMDLMYKGGRYMKAAAEQFLIRKAKELSDIYQDRLGRFSYHNHVGAAVDYYVAAIFEKAPVLEAKANGAKAPGKNPKDDKFWVTFLKDCDRKGTSFLDVMRRVLKDLLVFRTAYLLIDLPPKPVGREYQNAAEEKQAGQLNPYLCIYDPRHVINWSYDDAGNLDWIVIYNREIDAKPLEEAKTFDRWYYFDKTEFKVFEREVSEKETTVPDNAEADLVRAGRHALSDVGRVPIKRFEVPEGLWLMNRAYLPARDHINTDNALGYALHMAALAMPVIMTDGEFVPSLSECGFIKLPAESKYEWTEPAGTSFEHLANRVRSLVEDIYRAFYLIAQARTTSATPAAQSGVSKQQDMAPSKKILNLFGSVERNGIQSTLDDVAIAAGQKIEWDVRGLDFPEDLPDTEIAIIGDALAINVPSDTVEKELFKKVVSVMFPDANSDVAEKMRKEIDAAPSKLDREKQVMQAQADVITKKMGSVKP
jgi:hypothetical protein